MNIFKKITTKSKSPVESEELSDLNSALTNGKLRRALALNTVKYNNRMMILVMSIVTGVAIVSGNGKGLDIFGFHISPVSETALALIANIATYLLKGWMDEKNSVVNYYFVNEEKFKHDEHNDIERHKIKKTIKMERSTEQDDDIVEETETIEEIEDRPRKAKKK